MIFSSKISVYLALNKFISYVFDSTEVICPSVSVLIISKGNNTEQIKEVVQKTWQDLNVRTDILNMKPTLEGATIIS